MSLHRSWVALRSQFALSVIAVKPAGLGVLLLLWKG